MSLAPRSWSDIFRDLRNDPSTWPLATCPTCKEERHHPLGGLQICDDCAEMQSVEEENARAERASAELIEQMRKRREQLPRLLEKAGVPTRYANFTRDSWEAKYFPWARPIAGFQEVTPKLLKWTGHTASEWLVIFYGRYGQRKTSLATALFGERLVAGEKGLWIDAATWIHDMKARFGKDDEEEVFERARNADLLLVDDLGAILGARSGARESQSWWKEQFALLFRDREMWVKPTITTANIMSISELGAIDHSLVSRMDVDLAFLFDSEKNFRSET